MRFCVEELVRELMDKENWRVPIVVSFLTFVLVTEEWMVPMTAASAVVVSMFALPVMKTAETAIASITVRRRCRF